MAESPDVIAFPTLSDAQLARLVDYGEESPSWRPAGRFFGELSTSIGPDELERQMDEWDKGLGE